jgi:general stress protein 26
MTSTARTAATDRADAIGAAGATRAADAARAKEQRVTPELVIRELRTHDFGILSTVGAEGKPFSAGVNYGVGQTDAGLAIYVMTRRHLRKARNIAGNPHISLVVPLPRRVLWFLPPATIQLTGKTEILDWADRAGTEVFGRFWMGRRILEAYEKSRRRGETRVCFLRITPERWSTRTWSAPASGSSGGGSNRRRPRWPSGPRGSAEGASQPQTGTT